MHVSMSVRQDCRFMTQVVIKCAKTLEQLLAKINGSKH